MNNQGDAGTPFEDPLENYEPPVYADALEQAIAEQPIGELEITPFASVPPDTSIADATAKLAELHVACLLVTENKKLVGVYTDRNVLDQVSLDYAKLRSEPVSSVMTDEPVFVYDTDPLAAALSVTAVHGYRHVPVVNQQGEVVGILSPHRITQFLTNAFQALVN